MKTFWSNVQLTIPWRLDKEHKVISGLLAGLARYWRIDRLWCRLAALFLLVSLPALTAIVYVALSIYLERKE